MIHYKYNDSYSAYYLGTALLTLNAAGVAGMVIVLLVVLAIGYVGGFLTGLLLTRKRKQAPSISGDPSAPTYEQVHTVTPAQTSIPLKDNEAYGHLNT